MNANTRDALIELCDKLAMFSSDLGAATISEKQVKELHLAAVRLKAALAGDETIVGD